MKAPVSLADKQVRILATAERQRALRARVEARVMPWLSEPLAQTTIGGVALIAAFFWSGEPV